MQDDPKVTKVTVESEIESTTDSEEEETSGDKAKPSEEDGAGQKTPSAQLRHPRAARGL